VARAYGVWHRVGLDAWNTARPSVFIIDRAGIIRAVWVSDRQDEFPTGEEVELEVGKVGG
jgi:peroxiredoxin